MTAFIVIWTGQVFSLLGTAMTRFALTIWVFQETGEATALALMGFFSFAPLVIFSPIAGALVDRWNRKLVMILSDLGAGLATIAILLLYVNGRLEVWHLYVAGAFAGVFESFQFPAFSAAMSVLVPKAQYGRANGLLSLAEAASSIAAPVLAGILLSVIGIAGVMVIDIATFILAVAAVLLVVVPQPRRSAEALAAASTIWREAIYGFIYIWRRKSLLGVQLTFAISNFFSSIGMVLIAPMVLARTAANELALATVQSAMGVGGLVGGLVMTVWGGPKNRVHGVLLGFIGSSLLGLIPLGLGQNVAVWSIGAFLLLFFIPITNASNQALWQSKVPPDLQGRVFATRRLIAQISGPLGILLAGPLADRVFEPAMRSGGALQPLFAPFFGEGHGAGMALLIVIVGILGVSAGVVGYLVRVIREVDVLLADHDAERTSGDAIAAS
ncbi:putative major facilitator superfamily transporter [Caldilinea aerophila DSM 14535 = NBRC 104270]|uniref:Putative major facilitator superfamily transporter n=2 Tax=Caldilineaceae TaxID=475964 RepID=I0I187_CALAS|nr:putative major facilitator superfamily transporter [Caldilinea aerophila DSM 14535 = NBRC 104270]